MLSVTPAPREGPTMARPTIFAHRSAHFSIALIAAFALACVDDPDAEDIDEGGTNDTAETGPDPEAACLPCDADPDAGADPFADCVPVFEPAAATVEAGGWNHDQLPDIVLGPPGGTLDTLSLGCGGVIVLGFQGAGIVDGPGPDFIVFENPFDASFPEPMVVEVSADGCEWFAYACDPLAPADSDCAGATPVAATPGSDIDPTDPELAGGDAFDLADVGLEQAFFVRLSDRSEATWDAQYCDPGQAGKGGADLDALASVHG
ncbi:putative lipoprotein [Plesiocystis pacifica SIR-1]|uniref:Putative lipoprotein n=2 Tax=Plesiocystis pacifica TaxID=191768 RepID=A6G5H3_9BACT|nr:putative lipoprotein [Plesiocystis pacifica SIR-1]